MNRLMTVSLIALVALASLWPAAAQASGYSVTDLGVIPGAGAASSSQPRAINNSGWVVGDMPQYRLSTPPYKGWVWIPGAPNSPTGSTRALEPFAGGTTSAAFDINNQGLIVGVASNASGTNGAAFWQAPDFAPGDYNLLPRDPADPSLANWRLFQ